MMAHPTPRSFGTDFPALLEFLTEEAGPQTIWVGRFIEIMNWDMKTMVEKSRASDSTSTPEMVSDTMQQYMQQSLEVLRAAFQLNSNVEGTIAWFKDASIATFGGGTPANLVGDGRMDTLLRYIHSLSSGYSG